MASEQAVARAKALRTFVALAVPAPDLGRLDDLAAALRIHAEACRLPLRMLDRASWHVTLKFLGKTPASTLENVQASIERAASGWQSVRATPTGWAAFPEPARARVVALALDEPGGAMAALVRRLEDELEPLGFLRERRAFRPHITLARLKAPRDVRGVLERGFSEQALPSVIAFERVVWFESLTTAEGSRYTALAEWPRRD